MIAHLPPESLSNMKDYDLWKKELVQTYQVIHFDGQKMHVPVTVRCYMGKSRNASMVYASVWINGNGLWFSSTGTAGGYGYDKISAAIGDALGRIRVELTDDRGSRADIKGAGAIAVRQALFAIVCELFLSVTEDNTIIVEN